MYVCTYVFTDFSFKISNYYKEAKHKNYAKKKEMKKDITKKLYRNNIGITQENR
jgi:hypothetical protein